MAGNLAEPGTTVVSRALSLLYAFDERHRRLTLSDLAARSGLPVATAHRLVGDLVEGGALVRRGRHYLVGRRLWDVGLLAPLQTGLRETAAPFLSDLHTATLATVHLAIRDGRQALYLDRLSGRASVPVVSTIGSRLPLHSTGVGKVLLAHAPDEVQLAVLGSLARLTPYTVTAPAAMRRQLAGCRRDGYATTVEEMTLGACSVAVPVHGPGSAAAPSAAPPSAAPPSAADPRPVIAALGIVVPRLPRDRRLVTALTVAARGIERSLAATP